MDLEGLAAHLIARAQLLLDLRLAGGGQQGGQPVEVAADAGDVGASGDPAGPAHQGRHAEGTFPVGVLLAAEGSHAGVGPAVHMRPVVSAVHHDRVVGDAQLIEQVEHLADALVVIDHHVVVFRLPAAAAAHILGPGVGAEVHMGGVEPHEEGLSGSHRITDEALGLHQEFIIGRLHALARERAGALDPLAAVAVGPAVQHAAGSEALAEVGELRIVFSGVIAQFRFFFGVEVVEVAEELVEAVHRRQMLVAIAEMVLAELAGAVALGLEQLGDGGIFSLEALFSTRQAHLGETGAIHALAGDEGGTASRAALLGVVMDELGAFLGHPVDVRGLIPHQAVAIAAEIALADVIAPENQNVGFAVGHGSGCQAQVAPWWPGQPGLAATRTRLLRD